MVADMEVDKVADIGHGAWLIAPKLFQPDAYLACASPKLCEFILTGDDVLEPNHLPKLCRSPTHCNECNALTFSVYPSILIHI